MSVKDFIEEWNRLHCIFIQEGPEIRNKKMADWLEEKILEAKEAYYNTGTPIMEDATYDKMENYLKTLRPGSKILEKVGI